jgi:glutaredoxin
MGVTVYSKPNCVQCTGTYRAMDKLGVQYDVIDITTDPHWHSSCPPARSRLPSWSSPSPASPTGRGVATAPI